MAASAIHSAMNGDQALFPLFNKAAVQNEPPSQAIVDTPAGIHGLDGTYDSDERQQPKPVKPRKSRKKQIPGQKTLQEIVNPQAALGGNGISNGTDDELAEGQQEEPSPRRSKRRRTSRTGSVEVGGEDDEPADNLPAPAKRNSSPQVIIPASSPLPAELSRGETSEKATPPKKMLRLKAGGKFSSPVSKKTKEGEAPVDAVKRRGRPKKAKEQPAERHLIAVVAYDVNTEIGERVNRILAGEERYKKQVKIVPKKQSTPRKPTSKSAHPFFSLDRRKEQPAPPIPPSPRKTSAVTPGKLRREHPELTQPSNEPSEVWTSTLLKDRLMFRHPGAREPAWPDQEQMHVRSLSSSDLERLPTRVSAPLPSTRKRKAANRPLSQSDSILYQIATHLEVEKEGQLRADGFREAHPSLRLPNKTLMSGPEIARQAAMQLSKPLPNDKADEIIYDNSSQQPTHTAVQDVYERIEANLNANDGRHSETMAWAQRYAPSTCDQVLQPARLTNVLKEWLSSLKVMAVDSVPKPNGKSKAKAESKTKKRKRRRKDDDLDDFLVDSDEEAHDMDELTDPEDLSFSSQNRDVLNSIVQVAAEGAKLSNAVLLSGQPGCGKTAAAYAVAKELDFKVFEINSSERRSGKDVLDKVGDMTENHLVKHHGAESGEQSSTEEPNARLDEAFQRDLASGRQGTMASFFKPQGKSKPKPKTATPKEVVKSKALEGLQKVLKKPAKEQQQSVILLEEVDVLFKEDKDFWSTIFKLIITSKRPFIMTCNEEDLVPLQAMNLHAILRFPPPSDELATDYLILMAAAEGHLLRRDAVSTLYQSKGCDLRASISGLDFWCQMGIGDPRGGLSWIYQRYPPGSDLDEQGRRLRVVSERTYAAGMSVAAERAGLPDDRLACAAQEHTVHATAALGWDVLDGDALSTKLNDFSKFANDLSSVDVYARAHTARSLDTSQSPMSDKARSHYIEGLPLLQTDEQADYSGLSLELLASSTLLTFQSRQVLTSGEQQSKLNSIGSKSHQPHDATLPRRAFACFDTISTPAESALSTVSGLQQSVFDGPLEPIATDIAPYVRSIVHFDLALAEQREALGGGKTAKRARTTRAARSALEGGQRASTRRERWFPKELNFGDVLATGGKGWPKMLAVAAGDGGVEGSDSEAAPASSAEGA